MHRFALLCCAAVLVGCGKTEEQPAGDTTAAAPPTADAPAAPAATPAMSLSDLAGKWRMRTTDEAGGTPVEFELNITADTSGWTLTPPGRKPIPVRLVAISGDSLVTEAGPYESAIVKGVQVRTRTVTRLQDGKLVGATQATYSIGGRDSVARRPTEGTRAP